MLGGGYEGLLRNGGVVVIRIREENIKVKSFGMF